MKGLPFLTFTKMHALGNDFILIDEKAGELHQASKIAESNRSKLVTFLCKPHFGIGADGVLFMSEPTNPKAAILKYRYFNSDGSEAQMCGNGIRCFSKYAFTRGYIPKGVSKFCLETNVGLKEVEILLDGKGEENNEVIKIVLERAVFWQIIEIPFHAPKSSN